MPRLILPTLILLSLAACAGDQQAPVAAGAWHTLAPAQWDLNPELVTVPAMPQGKH